MIIVNVNLIYMNLNKDTATEKALLLDTPLRLIGSEYPDDVQIQEAWEE